jgi:hypothetical protein
MSSGNGSGSSPNHLSKGGKGAMSFRSAASLNRPAGAGGMDTGRRRVLDASALEAQFGASASRATPGSQRPFDPENSSSGGSAMGGCGGYGVSGVAPEADDAAIEFDDEFNDETFGAEATSGLSRKDTRPTVSVSPPGMLTLEELERQFRQQTAPAAVQLPAKMGSFAAAASSGAASKAQVASAVQFPSKTQASSTAHVPLVPSAPPALSGPPPGMKSSAPETAAIASSLLPSVKSSSVNSASQSLSSTAPLFDASEDNNRGFMNRFERDLIQRIHTVQLATDNPRLEDFYCRALMAKRASSTAASNSGKAPLLYFPLPSAAERLREQQRRQRRRERLEKQKQAESGHGDSSERTAGSVNSLVEDVAALVLGKVSHSTSRKPRQQLQVPSTAEGTGSVASLHEQVLGAIERVYSAVLSVDNFFLLEEQRQDVSAEQEHCNLDAERRALLAAKNVSDRTLEQVQEAAAAVVSRELLLVGLDTESVEGTTRKLMAGDRHHFFIHFLTVPKGRAILPRALKLIPEAAKEVFLFLLVGLFDFMEVIRPEASLAVVDAFIAQVLSPLVPFVGEADWSPVLKALEALYAKRSFVWIALTKAGTVLLCILLSRLEILKAGNDGAVSDHVNETAMLTEKTFDSLAEHLSEFFASSGAAADDNREFYSWQLMALLAMNVDSDRKRSMIVELRDRILAVVEGGDEAAIGHLNVFLNALGLDASQLQ